MRGVIRNTRITMRRLRKRKVKGDYEEGKKEAKCSNTLNTTPIPKS